MPRTEHWDEVQKPMSRWKDKTKLRKCENCPALIKSRGARRLCGPCSHQLAAKRQRDHMREKYAAKVGIRTVRKEDTCG